ncbi:hypothetical protein, partial [Mycoplasmopsis bovis]|uniref:hypothetical protein n=1 Tax=Mycoplasmopsis bovis TaxID=28903 RepID=UPI003D2D17C2
LKVIEPKVVEGVKDAEGNYVIIHKVLMHNADGSPVLSVPLNVDLTDTKSPYYDKNAVKFVNDKINTINLPWPSLIMPFSIERLASLNSYSPLSFLTIYLT